MFDTLIDLLNVTCDSKTKELKSIVAARLVEEELVLEKLELKTFGQQEREYFHFPIFATQEGLWGHP